MNPNNVENNRITIESVAIATAKLICEKQPLSVTAICKRAGVSRNAYYRNFESIDDVLIYYVALRWAEYSAVHNVDKLPMEQIGKHLLRFFYEQRNFVRALKERGQDYIIEKLFVNICVPKEIDDGMRYYLYGICYFVYGFIRAMIDNNFADSPEKIEEITSTVNSI